ncbi:MAG: cupredoxin domain-containing protein [Myxococcales bacterium]
MSFPVRTLAAVALALPSLVALAQTGTLAGKVEARPAKYLKETVVYLTQAPGTEAPKTATMNQKNRTFLPHVLAITVGDTVKFENGDTVDHNVFSPDITPYNLGTFKPGESRTHTFDKPGAYSQLCSLHPEMLAYVYVAPTPYHAVVKPDGSFTIKGVPPGDYQVAIWNAHLKASPQPATVAAGQTAKVSFALSR